jgi:hypothetical protein
MDQTTFNMIVYSAIGFIVGFTVARIEDLIRRYRRRRKK